jgi:uncharacterized protein YkwD
MRTSARGGSVVVLGPSGVPRQVPTSFDGETLRARFAPDEPGPFLVQMLADVAGGVRPVIEATVFADVPPSAARAPVPSEGVGAVSSAGDDGALFAMTAAARAWSGLRALMRDPRLDEVAREHAWRMARSSVLAHDVGDGDPAERVRAADVDARDVGENVARASTAAGAHRALWESPSHRANLVRREFDRVGVGAVRDAQGMLWVVEEFAGGER